MDKPEPRTIKLLNKCRLILSYAINKILSLNLKTIRKVHRELYRELRAYLDRPLEKHLQVQGLLGGTLIEVRGRGLKILVWCDIQKRDI